MALRIASRRAQVLYRCSKCYGLREGETLQRNASSMAVPTSSQPEMMGNDISVCPLGEGFFETSDLMTT